MKIFASDIAQSKLFHIAHLCIDLQKNSSLFLNSLPSFGQIPPETPRIFLSKWEFEVYTFYFVCNKSTILWQLSFLPVNPHMAKLPMFQIKNLDAIITVISIFQHSKNYLSFL